MVIVIFDGMDKTGKTTISREVARRFGFEYVKFPRNRELAEQIVREGDVDKMVEFFIDDYVSFVNLISDGDYVFDRSYVSTMLYQGTLRGDPSFVRRIFDIVREKTDVLGDVVFLLYRREVDGGLLSGDVFEEPVFQRRIVPYVWLVSHVLREAGIKVVEIDVSKLSLQAVRNLVFSYLKVFIDSVV